MIEVRRVGNRKMMQQFIMFPWSSKIYENDPLWVPPLISEMKEMFNPGKGYFFEIGEVEFFLAYKDDVPVGRITAHINHLYEKKYDMDTGFFGFFESINDPEVAGALFDAASDCLKRKGKKVMNGPQSFSIYDSVGFEVNGLDKMPVVGLFRFAPYYKDLAEACGFVKCIDWHCFRVKKSDYHIHEEYLKEVKNGIMKDMAFEFKILDKREIKKRAEEVHEIFNRAWDGNWGHLPLTRKQVDMFFKQIKVIAIPELAIFAEKNGKTVGFIISLPDVNPAMRILNGRLYPWRLLRFMREAKKTKIVRTLVMGVLPEYRGQKIDDVFYLRTIEDGIRMGFLESDCSLIVETNTKMIGALKPLSPHPYKTYRIYERPVP
jgi:hypothetical protein